MRVTKYVKQYVTALVMIYSPTVNDTHYPLGTATTCSSERYLLKKTKTIPNPTVFDEILLNRILSPHLRLDGCMQGN